jgi:type I restriction enzyme M protein
MQRRLVGLIFAKPQSKKNDPAKLHLLIQVIDSKNWSRLNVDVKGEAYEGPLNAVAGKVDSGQSTHYKRASLWSRF